MTRLVVVTVCLIASGCGGSTKNSELPVVDTTAPPSTATPDATLSPAAIRNKTMADYEAAWAAMDPHKAASAYTEDGVVQMAGAPAVSGREAIEELIAGMIAGSKDIGVPFTRTFWIGSVMVGEWVWGGTHTGELMGVPATGKAFGVRGVTVYEFSPEGLIAEARLYVDLATLMAQLGVAPPNGRAIEQIPTDDPTGSVAKDDATEQRNVTAAREMNAAFEHKNEADFVSSFGDDVVWEDMTQAMPMQGKEGAKQVLQLMTTAFPDLTITARNVWGAGDYVIFENTMTGTHEGALGPIPATQQPIEVHGIDIMQFGADGKIVRGWTYNNSIELLMQLGLVPPPE